MTNITFGIVVGPSHNNVALLNLIHSIEEQKISKYEIILVGKDLHRYKKIVPSLRVIEFDESIKPGWITKKKNIVSHNATYDNLCIMHDYLFLSLDWYDGLLFYEKKYGTDWNILLGKVYNREGTRHADWLVNPERMDEVIATDRENYTKMIMEAAPHENHPKFVSGLPYGVHDLSHIQYISGGYVFCKKSVLETVPMNEELKWGDGEDVEWSNRLSKAGYLYKFNEYSDVWLQKEKKWRLYQMPDAFVEKLREYYGSKI